MSDQSKERNDEAQEREKPGKRLEGKAKPAPANQTGPQAKQRAKLSMAAAQAKQQAQKEKEKRIMIVMIVLAAVAVAATALVLGIKYALGNFGKPTLSPGPDQPGSVTQSKDPNASYDPNGEESEDPTLDFDAVQPLVGGERKSEDIYTILIFGTDETSGLTDTIMVCTYDVTNQQATAMSIPRDTLVNVRTAYKNINGVYNQNGKGERGLAALKREVSELVGFVPDYYVRIDWNLVGEMVDAIGGVWFDNPYHMEYYDPYQDLEIYQEQGYRLLSGRDAMQVVRWRHNNPGVPYNPGVSNAYAASDLERLEVQHAFLKATLKQTLQIQNVFRIGKLAELFGSRVESDLSIENIFWFAKEAILGGLGVDDVNFCTMPVYGVYQGRFANRVYPNQSELLKLINSSLNPFVEQVTIRQLDLIRVSSDGDTLSSSTGVLADPSAAIPPVRESDPPEESDPLESGEPGESDPLESGEPGESDPPESTPPTVPPVTAPPGGDEPADGDWGDTPD